MNLKVGIVGLPNAGKSTLFNALLKKQVADVAPYPFCTIEPNVGVVPVPDGRLVKLAEITKQEEKIDTLPPIVPTVVEFVDIAGLVKGASKGEGLGNKFLSHIREVDIICHVIRYFDDPSVVHVAGAIDPMRDKEMIETELLLADLETLEKQSEPKGIKDKEAVRHWELISILKSGLNAGKSAREIITADEDKQIIRDLHLLSMKPVLYIINVNENQISTFQVTNYKLPTSNFLQICAKTESELLSLSESDQKEYMASLGLSESGLNRLIQKAYQMLGLITFFSMVGLKEIRAWTIEKSTKAPQAAGTIHTDFEKKFIKADVVSFEDFVSIGGWKKAREVGKVRQEGREYVMKDGDVVEFKIGS